MECATVIRHSNCNQANGEVFFLKIIWLFTWYKKGEVSLCLYVLIEQCFPTGRVTEEHHSCPFLKTEIQNMSYDWIHIVMLNCYWRKFLTAKQSHYVSNMMNSWYYFSNGIQYIQSISQSQHPWFQPQVRKNYIPEIVSPQIDTQSVIVLLASKKEFTEFFDWLMREKSECKDILQSTARVTHAPYISSALNPFRTGIANRKPRVLIYIEHTANRPRAE